MADESKIIYDVFTKMGIEGLDFKEGIERFGGNPKLYIKIIKTFVDKIGAHLSTLEELKPEKTESGSLELGNEKLESYWIEAHGIKGSCYGISANKAGDMARGLELAAKAGDLEAVYAGNDLFVTTVNELTGKLQALLDEIEEGAGSGRKMPRPDKSLLTVMLRACQDFDVALMQKTLKELERYEYESDGDLVKWLSEQVTDFGYDKIEERLKTIL